ncbi:peroxiredoxin [Stagnihabitans tardus]|uniref:thioredoxin-dependent peroxiredoxin n=1 Tax=Stagnihabitans tardus TaxID=2699202 RepID=A0AAE4Y781_9RHOB|nr:peroxiredoxin [Stagnihabitans tardus]NBZ87103.1 redoxin domain-containing protein [Stagnihabitans tardus]
MADVKPADHPPIGQMAPDFTLMREDGSAVTLSALRGSRVVLFTYGADGTPSCTNEIMEFQALLPEFQAAGVTVLGLSKDGVEKHRKFAAKQGLGMALLSDKEGHVMEDWGSYGAKIFFGKEVVGVLRSTFLIGADGVLEKTWRVEKVKGHAAEVLTAVKG